ncbi:unnamed protein product [Thelazia callipaeda]|uniref:WD_REPEATS_REGION domain-containing protein n=1 Tax=Thelazia callipaeda TaxID=103827 RepID=A0A0N5D969_THECL|nr:unnamed protein product [Thelazia callipaeda]
MFHFAGGSTEGTIPHPNDTQISKVQFSPDENGQLLAVSSWDSFVRLYNFPAGPVTALEKRSYSHSKPVLSCAFFSNKDIASGGLDSLIKIYNIESGEEFIIGHHKAPVRCLEYSKQHNLIVSGSWDSSIMLWDTRSKSSAGFGNNGDKVYALDCHDNRVLVGTSSRKIFIWDVRNLGEPEQIRDSPLKAFTIFFQIRSVKCFPNGEAFVVASIEGRVAVEYFDMSAEVQKNKYAFKCHREKDQSGAETIYPVNCIDFHPLHNTFVTGGSDALVNFWDPFNRKRICQLHNIMSVSFNANGTQLAIAASYMNELKERQISKPESIVVVRKITDVEAKPR